MTLAAVDEGILQLTRFKTPNPADYYFGKRRLGVAMRDDYGRLLETRADDLGRIRVGGDAGDIGGLDIVPTRTVALFSGPVKLDAQGEAKIAFEVPDFIGQLRLMAVAYAKSRVGSGDQRLLRARRGQRRRRAAALPGAQRSRAAGAVAAQHRRPGRRLSRRPCRPRARCRSSGRSPRRERLAAGQRELLTWPLVAANEAGFGKVAVEVSGPGNFAVRREWDIQVRAAQTPSAVDTVSQLGAGREAHARPQRHSASFAPGTSQVGASLTRIPGIDVAGPAAGARQVSVRLHRADDEPRPAAALLQRRGAARVTARPIRASAIACRRRSTASSTCSCADGSFGMWGPSPRRPPNGCRAYALDFLLRATRAADGGAVGVAAARPDLAQPHGRQVLAQRPGLCLVRAGEGGPAPIPAASATSRTRRRPR